MYFSDPGDLVSRLQLVAGDVSPGNNSKELKNEFTVIVYELIDLGEIANEQLRTLQENYFM